MRAASAAAASSARRFASALAASRASLALARAAACASRSACRAFTAGSSGPGWALNLFRISFLACFAAFWRSAKLGSLNPLIDEALLLSWFVVGAIAWTQTSAAIATLAKSAGVLYRRARREAINYRGDDSMSRGKIRIPHALG